MIRFPAQQIDVDPLAFTGNRVVHALQGHRYWAGEFTAGYNLSGTPEFTAYASIDGVTTASIIATVSVFPTTLPEVEVPGAAFVIVVLTTPGTSGNVNIGGMASDRLPG